MKRTFKILIPILLIVGGLTGWFLSRPAKPTSLYRLGVVDRGKVQLVVTATGTVSAVTTVQVGSQVSGTIQNLYVDFNSPVRKGEVVARIDPTFLQAAVNESQANLQRAQATLAQAQRDLARTDDLFKKNLAAQSDYDNAQTAKELAEAGLAQTQAQLDRAKVNLAYAVIRSPTDGTVISRNVDVGQTVAASLQAPTLFTIAQDLRQMQIETDIDEADIGGLKEKMDAAFTVDAFPEEVFHGTVQQIRYASQTSQGVVTYPVMIAVSNPDLKLRPGMTANVTIVTAERDDVLRAPAVALRFRPAEAAAAVRDTTKIARDTTKTARDSSVTGRGAAGGRGQGRGSGQWGGHLGDSTAVGGSTERRRPVTVWIKGKDGKPEARQVTVGLNDGNRVEITGGEIAAGDSVIVGLAGTSATANGSNRMPGFGGGPGGGGPRR
jgi:HlyD family secretion protein